PRPSPFAGRFGEVALPLRPDGSRPREAARAVELAAHRVSVEKCEALRLVCEFLGEDARPADGADPFELASLLDLDALGVRHIDAHVRPVWLGDWLRSVGGTRDGSRVEVI